VADLVVIPTSPLDMNVRPRVRWSPPPYDCARPDTFAMSIAPPGAWTKDDAAALKAHGTWFCVRWLRTGSPIPMPSRKVLVSQNTSQRAWQRKRSPPLQTKYWTE
jgi:hypothetical protein